MTLTTNPTTVTAGRVRVSLTDNAKRDALIGRAAKSTCWNGFDRPDSVVVGTITHFRDGFPMLTIHRAILENGEESFDLKGSTIRLDSVVTLVDECGVCHYSSGHWPYCPNNKSKRVPMDKRIRRAQEARESVHWDWDENDVTDPNYSH